MKSSGLPVIPPVHRGEHVAGCVDWNAKKSGFVFGRLRRLDCDLRVNDLKTVLPAKLGERIWPTLHQNRSYLSDSWLESASRRFSGKSYTIREACPPDSWKTEFFGDVQPLPDEPIVTKHRYNAFHGTDLDLILRTHGIRTLVTTGVATNVCVETTARDGFVRDYYILFPKDGTATWSLAAHEATLRNIGLFFGEVTTIDDLRKVWKQYEGRGFAPS